MRVDRAWVRLGSGRRRNLVDPQPSDWTDRDLAVGLSRTYRWGGHSIWDLPLSVTQHSLMVMMLRQEKQTHHPLTPGQALRELLHDADEGLLGFDPISPLKPHLGAEFGALTTRLRQAIAARYELRETEHAEVPITHLICRKLIDRGDLLRQLSISANDPNWADATLGRADEVRRPDPGSARAKAGLPASRDFR